MKWTIPGTALYKFFSCRWDGSWFGRPSVLEIIPTPVFTTCHMLVRQGTKFTELLQVSLRQWDRSAQNFAWW